MCKNKDCFDDTCKGECVPKNKKKKNNKEDWPWYRQTEKDK